MTREGERRLLGEHLATCRRLDDRLRLLRERLGAVVPLTGETLAALDPERDIDLLAFLKTFEQYEDTLGRTLRTVAMLMEFGRVQRLTARDVAERAVALGVIESGAAWADAVRTRNALAYEYPLRPDKQAEQVNAAWHASATLVATRDAIERFVGRERLLSDAL